MKFPVTLLLIPALLFGNQLLAQRVQFITNPDKAWVIMEGTSVVSRTSSNKKLGDGGVLIYKESHHPVYLESSEIQSRVAIDLVPVVDLIGEQKTKNLDFSKLVLNIPHSKEIGSVGASQRKILFTSYVQRSFESNLDLWVEMIERELSERKVQVHVESVDLFGGHSTKRTEDFLLGAEVVNVWISTTVGMSYAFVELKWSLFDKRKREVVLDVTTFGFGEGIEGKRTHLDDAFITATTHLTADEEFVNAIMGGVTGGETADEPDFIPVLKLNELDIDMGSNLIKRCIASTVTLITNDGHGSGVIISDEGLILTNHHVVDQSDEVRVVFSSGMELEGTVIRSDEYYDVALVKINSGKGYRALPLALSGDAPAYEVGDDVMAIGTPEFLDLGQTVSRGIVSGNRMAEDRQFIQTDVSINPGNSGGPLINSKGEVIGLVTMKKFDSTGIGFAVPVDQAVKVLNIRYE